METGFTIKDLCQLEGAIIVLQRYAKHLRKHTRNAIDNYESSDFDEVAFLEDVGYARDNASVIAQTREIIESSLNSMRAEVAPTFKEDKED